MRTNQTLLTAALLLVLTVPHLGAQETTPSLDQMGEMLMRQQKLIDRQSEELERQNKLLEQQSLEISEQGRMMVGMQGRIDEFIQSQGGTLAPSADDILMKEKIAALEQAVQDEAAAPADVLRAGEFPGSILLPGTNMAAKVGGFVRLGVVNSFDPIGTDDRFVVGTIPAEGTEVAGEGSGTTISAKRSRLNLDMRMDSSVGQFRAFLEGDFAGDGGTDNYRLRHAYGQYNRFLLGQTWSTFMDLRATPEELDFEGLSGRLQVRQPLMRWANELGTGRLVAIALEDPAPSIAGGGGVSRFPDVTARTSWERPQGHLQVAAIARALRAQEVEDPTQEAIEFGWGLSLSGRHFLGSGRDGDNLMIQLNGGRGIGRYINDLGSVGEQDAVFDPETGELEALPAFGGYVAWEHWWRDNTWSPNFITRFFNRPRTTFIYSYVGVNNFDFQDDGAYASTHRATTNFIFSPITNIDMGIETLWGERKNKDGSKGDALQLQLVATFRF